MLLSSIISSQKTTQIVGDSKKEITQLSLNSKEVEKGCCFFAIRGNVVDGHEFIENAIEKGAMAIICERLPQKIDYSVCYVIVENAPNTMGLMAAEFYDNPSKKMKIVGVTGTNGKTTIVTSLYNLFLQLGYNVGLLSTITNNIGKKTLNATHTTPDAISIQKLLSQMVDEGCEYCFMEVSSHSLVQERVAGIHFAGGVFTNITHDHLDYHKTFKEYIRAKKLFFDNMPKGSFALINKDDKNGEVMLQNCNAKKQTYSSRSLGDFSGKILERNTDGMLISINKKEVWVRLLGDFNLYNLLAVYGVSQLLGIDEEQALITMSLLNPVAGRFDTITSKEGKIVVVDYAHTPDALANVLSTIKKMKSENIITVVGCGGDRDVEKRPEMAREATQNSDTVILTSDNPRSEKPEDIIKEMKAGLSPEDETKTLTIVDRKEAIKTAIRLAGNNDIVLVAGKGHENYQIIEDKKTHFDDREVVEQLLKNNKHSRKR